jgi:hypothetical protein
MRFDDSLKDKIRELDIKNPQFAILLKQALEYWASLKDNDINNQLLQDLVFKYSAAEKKMKQLNQELLDKQKRAFYPTKLIRLKTWRLPGNLNPVNIWAAIFSICFSSMMRIGVFICSMSAGMGFKRPW